MIYLDNAATSFPKPSSVVLEQMRCMRQYCGNPGRGAHRLSLAAAEKIYECRTLIAEHFFAPSPERVTFTQNTTMALNFVIKGLLRDGDHVLISDMEHNAVYRPIARLAAEGRITYDVFPTHIAELEHREARICTAIARRIRPNTRMLICAHASNICSASLPLERIGALCRKRGILFVVDAAQSAGHLPIDVTKMKIDALCAPGHKGLLGPQGCGFVLWGEEVAADTLMEGGSGVFSLDVEMPGELPERFEAGTLPTPAIAGLCEGIREVERIGLEEILFRESSFYARLQSMLLTLPEVEILAPQYEGAILSFFSPRMPSDRIAEELDRRGFCVRAGLHCSPQGHRTLGTLPDGAVRVSPGIYSKLSEAEALFIAVREILK